MQLIKIDHRERKERQREEEKLKDQVNQVLQECRVVLPGIQALFGFQLIAVFNQRFAQVLSPAGQNLHWFALACTALAAILAMAPVAYHRQVERGSVSQYFVDLASLWLTWGMLPLALGTVVDFYLIGRAITGNPGVAGLFSLLLATAFAGFWWIFPELRRRERLQIEHEAKYAGTDLP